MHTSAHSRSAGEQGPLAAITFQRPDPANMARETTGPHRASMPERGLARRRSEAKIQPALPSSKAPIAACPVPLHALCSGAVLCLPVSPPVSRNEEVPREGRWFDRSTPRLSWGANCWLSSPQRQQDATEHQALWHALCTVTVTPTYWGLFPWLCPKGHFSSNKVSALKPLEAHNQNQRTEASRLRFPGCLPRCWWSTEEEIAFKWKKKKDKLKKKKEKKKILIQNLQSAVRCASARGCSPGASFKGTSQGLETAWLLQTGAWSFCWLCSPTDGDELQTGGRGLQLRLQALTPKLPVHSSLCENSSI